MIVFEKVRWKNFLSTGDKVTEVELNRSPSTLIVGHNGAGKSTLLDALSFALFGKPHRDIKKPQLINTINNKNCLVEVEALSPTAKKLSNCGPWSWTYCRQTAWIWPMPKDSVVGLA